MACVKDDSLPGSPDYNAKAARAKLMSMDPDTQDWGAAVPDGTTARTATDKMECYTCHTSWTTSCGGCHLPIEANWKTERHHYEGGDDAQLRDLQPAGRARRHVHAGRARRDHGRQDRAGALVLGAGAVLDQHQSRAHLRAAAADLRERLQLSRRSIRTIRIPSARRKPRPATTATSRRTTTTTPSWRSC